MILCILSSYEYLLKTTKIYKIKQRYAALINSNSSMDTEITDYIYTNMYISLSICIFSGEGGCCGGLLCSTLFGAGFDGHDGKTQVMGGILK